MFIYQYIEEKDREYVFKRYYNNRFDGYAIFSLVLAIDMLRHPEQIYDDITKTFLEYLKLQHS